MKKRHIRGGFTLLELLVVIGIITLLLSILLPVFSGVRARGVALRCQNNERQLWQGIVAFAADNEGRVVGSQFDYSNSIPSHQCFLRGPNGPPNGWQLAPQAGTLWKYVHNTSAYLCPARDPSSGVHGSTANLDLTSNGHFDYAIFLSFAGAKLEHLPTVATRTDPGTGAVVTLPAPYLVEEQPNGLNGGANMEGGHANTDQLAHNHFGGSYYMCPDGSCQFSIEPSLPSATAATQALNYTAIGVHGKPVNMGQNWTWGTWDGQ